MATHSDKPELLAPAGNWDCARAAVASGANAIFFGLSAFNARLRADNFTNDDLPELMDFLHKHGVRGYVTMNTLIFTSELPAAVAQLRWLDQCGVDAAIIQDLGLAKLAKAVAPNVDLHASTQMTITSPQGLDFINSVTPLDTAVLSRELSVQEIARFQKAGNTTPLEVFVHGALCVAYSGQCLTSESLGQRSANRGECAQACRMPYSLIVDGEQQKMGEVRYLLSPQDLAAVDMVPDLIQAGVKSFKIEGRLKSPEYVAAVTSVYRKAIDDVPITAYDRYGLEMTFSRGLSTGWLAGTNHPYLTHGRFGKKRGSFLGKIIDLGAAWVELDTQPEIALKPGDGLVIDSGEDRNKEHGGRLWKVDGQKLYFHHTSKIDWSRVSIGQRLWKTSDPQLDSDIKSAWRSVRPQTVGETLDLVISGQPDQPLIVEGRCGDLTATVQSKDHLQLASKRALDTETLRKQFGKLGDSRFELGELQNNLVGENHFSLSGLNLLRRELVEHLEAQEKPNRLKPSGELADYLPQKVNGNVELRLSVLCRSLEQVEAAVRTEVPVIYCDFEDPRRYKEAVAECRESQSEIYLATPRIQKPSETGYFKLIANAEPDGVLIRNLGAIDYYKESNLKLVGDFSLNVANPVTASVLMETGRFEHLTISYDLNIEQVVDMVDQTPTDWLELTLHQHMPMFHMEHCVFCTFLSEGTSYKDCGRPCETHVVHLKDRVGQLHRLHADVGCRNTLFNGRAQTGARFFPKLKAKGLTRFRMELLDETYDEALESIFNYQNLLLGKQSPDELLSTLEAVERLGVTEGTLVEM